MGDVRNLLVVAAVAALLIGTSSSAVYLQHRPEQRSDRAGRPADCDHRLRYILPTTFGIDCSATCWCEPRPMAAPWAAMKSNPLLWFETKHILARDRYPTDD